MNRSRLVNWLCVLVLLGIPLCLAVVLMAQREAQAARRMRVEKMSVEQKTELERKLARFSQLPAEEQQRMRTLDEQMASAPDRSELNLVLTRYHEWLTDIDPEHRSQIMRLASHERLERIENLRADERREAARVLAKENVKPFEEWSSRFAKEVAPAGWKPPDPLWLKANPQWVLFSMARRRFGDQRRLGGFEKLTQQDVDELRKVLSAGGQKQLDSAETLEDKRGLVDDWARQIVRKFRFPEPDIKELERFSAGLDDDTKKQLDRLPQERMRQRLKFLYWSSRGREDFKPDGRSGFGPPRQRGPDGGPSGEGRPRDRRPGEGPDSRERPRGARGGEFGPPGPPPPHDDRPPPKEPPAEDTSAKVPKG